MPISPTRIRSTAGRLAARIALATGLVFAVGAPAVAVPADPAGAATIAFGNVIAYDELAFPGMATIHIVNVTTGKHYSLIKGSTPAWAPDGARLAFIDLNNKVVIRNANGSLIHTGITADGLTRFSAAFMQWSPDGAHLLFHRGSFVYLMNTTAPYRPHAITPANSDNASFSPDGQRIVYSVTVNVSAILRVERLDGSDTVTITAPTSLVNLPAWSPDGTRIVFRDVPTSHLRAVAPDGSNPVDLGGEILVTSQPTFTSDSTEFAYTTTTTIDDANECDLVVRNADGTGRHVLLTSTTDVLGQPAWRP